MSITQRLREVEHEITRLNEAMAVHRPVKLEAAVDGIRDHVVKSIRQLGEMLKAEAVFRAKEALAKHVGKLVLTPVENEGRPVYKVSGSVSVQPPDNGKCRMQLVARDGIEPPPPALQSCTLPMPARRSIAYRPNETVPTPVPSLFLMRTAATHCVYSLVPIVPSVLCLRSIWHSSRVIYIANSGHTEHSEHDETSGDGLGTAWEETGSKT